MNSSNKTADEEYWMTQYDFICLNAKIKAYEESKKKQEPLNTKQLEHEEYLNNKYKYDFPDDDMSQYDFICLEVKIKAYEEKEKQARLNKK